MKMCGGWRWLCVAVLVLLCVNLSLGQHFKHFYNQIWRTRGSSRTKPTTTSAPYGYARPSRPSRPASRPSWRHFPFRDWLVNRTRHVTDTPAALSDSLPPGLTPDDLPKSLRARLTGDPDYVRLRQLALRELCQRLLSGSSANRFFFCFQLLDRPLPPQP